MIRKTAQPPSRDSVPPHLQEICAILAIGLLRLRNRSSNAAKSGAILLPDGRESSLHFRPDPSVYAAPKTGRAV